MGANAHIEWTDATWNPIGGCSIKSKGCTHCYAQRMAGTRLATHPLYAGTTSPSKAGPVFNGRLTAAPDDHPVWTWPLRWRGPKVPRRGPGARPMVFVGDMSDLFHEDRPDEVIDRVFAVMALCPHIDFQVLTKRPERMRDYLRTRAGDWLLRWPEAVPVAAWHISKYEAVSRLGANGPEAQRMYRAPPVNFPLANVWAGASVEDQPSADDRVPIILDTPAAVRFVSAEPLLGPIDFTALSMPTDPRSDDENTINALTGLEIRPGPGTTDRHPRLDWIIVGGESGSKARPMHPDWPRSIRDQCQAAGTVFLFKQWGEYRRVPADLEYAVETGDVGQFERVGKKAAGRLLDGREWNEFPRIAA